MQRFLGIARVIDRLTEGVGRATAWLVLVMTIIGAYNAVVRYLGRFMGWSLSANVYLELQWYIFSIIFLMGAGYALKHNAHVRVDVVLQRLSPRSRSWIDILGTLLLLVPFSVFVLWMSWPSVRNSWSIREMSPDPGGLPRYPLKAVILVCFVALLLQGVSQVIKEVARLRGVEGMEGTEESQAQEGGL